MSFASSGSIPLSMALLGSLGINWELIHGCGYGNGLVFEANIVCFKVPGFQSTAYDYCSVMVVAAKVGVAIGCRYCCRQS